MAATPPLTVTVPIDEPLSMKFTLPVGLTLAVIVAVNVICCPTTAVLADADSAEEVAVEVTLPILISVTKLAAPAPAGAGPPVMT